MSDSHSDVAAHDNSAMRERALKPIPALYVCYLLRSTIRHASLYVGSTPDPARRLRQHNGQTKGGAARTSRDSLRPWEMSCLVTGFPSKIAALQFEWAWQNPQTTRHITADLRITEAKTRVRVSPKTGRIRRRPVRPRLCLTDRLANLHILLESSSFARWPLQVTFLSPDVHRAWMRWIQQLELTSAARFSASQDTTTTDVPADYQRYKPAIQIRQGLFSDSRRHRCNVCRSDVPQNGYMTALCPSCNGVTHLDCMAKAFLHSSGDDSQILPTIGMCPGCNTELQWLDLTTELSLHMRGTQEVSRLLKPPGRKKAMQTGTAVPSTSAHSTRSDSPPTSDGSPAMNLESVDGLLEEKLMDDTARIDEMRDNGQSERWIAISSDSICS